MSAAIHDSDDAVKARAFFAAGDFAAAEILFRAAVAANPGDAAALYNLGVTLAKLERFEEAIGCYRAAIERNPAFADAYANFGSCLAELGLAAQARQAFAIARQLTPEDPIPRLNEGIAALALGDYAAGWQGFATRWELPAYGKFKREFTQPPWRGENLRGKTLLLYAEQGFGDSIQMARYAPVLAAQGARVIIEAQPALVKLFQSLPGAPMVITKGEALPAFDTYSAMMDAPGAAGTILETIPAATPYLFMEPAQAPRLRAHRVGLCWAGRASHENDRNRSLAFTQLAPLLAREDIEFASLQRLIPEGDESAFAASAVLDWGRSFADFSAAAVAIMALDLVITVDTAIAHLAGALGKPVWVLLPFYADWRWLLEREDSPWYPTARLFRQKKRRAADDMITRVASRLEEIFPRPKS